MRDHRPVTDPTASAVPDDDPGFEHLLVWLKESRGFDFTGYKRPSLVRRVARRMSDVGITDVAAYRDHLELHPAEFTALFNTVLINVTSFFRDQESWDHLTQVLLPPLLARNRPVRAWSAGCASGQEAYSLAIVMAEALGVEEFRRRVKIYATDVDEEALAAARAARYTEAELAGLRPEQVEKWFVRDGDRWTVIAPLRRAVVFGRNDLVQDAPISHIDVLMCRNTLMYLNAETQARVVGRLHFALEPHGVLMLGKAEMLLAHSPLFTPVDLPRRLFRRRAEPVLEGFSSAPRAAAADDGPEVLAHEALRTAPTAQVVIDGEGRLALANDQADRLFGTGPRDLGRPFQDLELSYRPLELRSHLDRALAEQRSQWVRGVELTRVGTDLVVLDVQVVPLVESDGTLLGATVVFDDVTRYHRLQDELEAANRKLAVAYEELQSTNEELETTNEELQSTVEELETTNEELQSTNEELETMNEELQSMNDQLHSGNDELREASELATGRRDMVSAVLAGMRAGVVVADDEDRLIAWNPASEELWGLREDEVLGQRLVDLDIGLPVTELAERLAGSDAEGGHRTVEVSAVNRRGRTVRVRATQSPVAALLGDLQGTVLVTELLD
ncbi:PAS domain S-box protein [Geodermatophilaceae bacterium NBWT11]|nr:PAS domain S-box protein [Geodermatophilaceae bacterium NBWT11]